MLGHFLTPLSADILNGSPPPYYLVTVELCELDVIDVLLVGRAEERLLIVHLGDDAVRRRRSRPEHLSVVVVLEKS